MRHKYHCAVITMAIMLGSAWPLMSAANASAEIQRFQDLDHLDYIIAIETGAAIGQTGGAITPVDRRLKLAQCGTAPIFRRINDRLAAISCEAPQWRLRVPLLSSPSAKVDTATSSDTITEPKAMKKGAKITVWISVNNMQLSTNGTAMQDGAEGDVILIKMEPFGKEAKARVMNFESVTLLDPGPGDS